ncbi:MAG: hypothetical protein ACOX0G_00745 [Patescibacteria group bacterium]|jgi:hypothetical protein
MKKKLAEKNTFFVVTTLIILILFSLGVRYWHIRKGILPFSLDPFYHMASSSYMVENKTFTNNTYNVLGNADYPPLLPLIGASAGLMGFDLIAFYKYFALAIAAVLGILMYLFLRYFFSPWPAVIGSIGYLSIPYVMHRTILTLPENLSLVFILAVILLLAHLNEQAKIAKTLLISASIIIVIIVNYFCHFTYLISIAITILNIFFLLLYKKKWIYALIVGICALIVGYFVKPLIIGNFSFALPELDVINKHFGYFPFLIGTIGLIGTIIFFSKTKKKVLLYSLLFVFVGGWFFYQGSGQGLFRLEKERWLILVGIALAIGFAGMAQIFHNYVKNIWVKILFYFFISIFLFWPRWSSAWPQIYNTSEYEAALYVKEHLPRNALYFSQPILEWLITGVGNRYVIWGSGQAHDDLATVDFSLLAKLALSFNKNSAYIVFSENPNNPENETLMSDGSKEPLDLSGILETPGIKKERFSCLPMEWSNSVVTIYSVPLSDFDFSKCTQDK